MSGSLVRCKCGQAVGVLQAHEGLMMKCPHCGVTFKVVGGRAVMAVAPAVSTDRPALRSTPTYAYPPRSAPARPLSPYPARSAQASGSFISDRTIRVTVIGAFCAISVLAMVGLGWFIFNRIDRDKIGPLSSSTLGSSSDQVVDPGDAASQNDADKQAVAPEDPPQYAYSSTMPVRQSVAVDTQPDFYRRGNASAADVVATPQPAPAADVVATPQPAPAADVTPAGGNPDPGSSGTDGPERFLADDAVQEVLSMEDLIQLVDHSVVRIDVKSEQGESVGSGFVIDTDGLVITNFHVMERASSASVTFSDGRSARVNGFFLAKPEHDLCLISIETALSQSHAPLKLVRQSPRKGQAVVAFGAPQGLSFSATDGIVSAIRDGNELEELLRGAYQHLGYSKDARWIQTSAAISGGNSGGPLVDMMGNVVGINTFGHSVGQNLNFAVSAETINKLMETRLPGVQPLSSLPKPTAASMKGEVLAALFGAESIVPMSEVGFEKCEAGPAVRQSTHHAKAINSIAVSADGKYLAVASADMSVVVYDMKKNQCLYSIDTQNFGFRNVAFVDGSRYLVTFRSAGDLPSVSYRDTQTGQHANIGLTRVVPKESESMAISPDGRSLFVSWLDGSVELRRYDAMLNTANVHRYSNFRRSTAASFSPDGMELITGMPDGLLASGTLVGDDIEVNNTHQGHSNRVNAVVHSHDGKRLASGGDDGGLMVWENRSKLGRWRGTRLKEGSAVLSVAFSADDTRLVAGRGDGTVEIYASTGRLIHSVALDQGPVTAVSFLPEGTHIVAGTGRGSVQILAAR